jgi:hypothetical protein
VLSLRWFFVRIFVRLNYTVLFFVKIVQCRIIVSRGFRIF